jgi:hypothetical protein
MSNKANGYNLPKSQMRSPGTVEYATRPEIEPQGQVYTYESPWKTYALAYSWRLDHLLRFGIGSFIDDQTNKVKV